MLTIRGIKCIIKMYRYKVNNYIKKQVIGTSIMHCIILNTALFVLSILSTIEVFISKSWWEGLIMILASLIVLIANAISSIVVFVIKI